MPRPSWLAPAVKPGAADASASVVVPRFHPNTPGTADDISGNAARNALHPWPLMPVNQPWSQPDINAQQPHNLRNFRRTIPAFARVPALAGGGVDWLALLQALYDEMLTHIDDKVNIVHQPFIVGTAATSVRPDEPRRYLFILNTDAANDLFVGFGAAPTGATTDFVIPAGSFFEPLKIPQNQIFLLGSAAPTIGHIMYAN